MYPNDYQVVEKCETPEGGLQLNKRGQHYEIISNGTFLMATYNGESERLLVTEALQEVEEPSSVLIGGLGVGFSLGAALTDPRVVKVTVVEIHRPIIDWNRKYLSTFSVAGLDDPRTEIVHDDLVAWIQRTSQKYDVICLDIDNGPNWTVFDGNLSLYSDGGLHQLACLLSPCGVISFWSAAASPEFEERLKVVFQRVWSKAIAQDAGSPDYIYMASNPIFTEETD